MLKCGFGELDDVLSSVYHCKAAVVICVSVDASATGQIGLTGVNESLGIEEEKGEVEVMMVDLRIPSHPS